MPLFFDPKKKRPRIEYAYIHYMIIIQIFIVGSCLQVDPIPHSFNSFSSPPPPPPPPPHTRFKGLLIHTMKVDRYLPRIKSIIFYHFSFEYVIFYFQDWNYHISFEYNFHIQDAQGPEIEIQKRIPFLLIFVVLSFFFVFYSGNG